MSYTKYKSDLHRIHQSEVYGIHVFKMANKVTFNYRKKSKWLLLCELEIQTLDQFIHFMQKTEKNYHYPFFWGLKGYIDGLILGLLPWFLAMRLLRKGTQNFILIWLRLKSNSNDVEQSFFDYIYAHEKAIQSFALAESRQEKNSVKAILALLNQK